MAFVILKMLSQASITSHPHITNIDRDSEDHTYPIKSVLSNECILPLGNLTECPSNIVVQMQDVSIQFDDPVSAVCGFSANNAWC